MRKYNGRRFSRECREWKQIYTEKVHNGKAFFSLFFFLFEEDSVFAQSWRLMGWWETDRWRKAVGRITVAAADIIIDLLLGVIIKSPHSNDQIIMIYYSDEHWTDFAEWLLLTKRVIQQQRSILFGSLNHTFDHFRRRRRRRKMVFLTGSED